MRDPARTNEPFGADPPENTGITLAGTFVVHLHAATRTHHDLRLPIGGVLTSFAIPKGPSLDPSEKRFAAHTEDHPIEYLDFEAVVPEGNYGAGPMIVWDRGRVRYLDGPAEEEIERGKIDFELSGYKLKGRFALVKIKKSSGGKDDEWLFFKKPDAYAAAGRDIAAEEPRSVLSGLTVEELRRMPEVIRAIEEEAAALGAQKRQVDGRAIVPMACSASGAPASGEGWIYELKLDGVRALAIKEGREVSIRSRSRRDITATFPEVARAVGALAAARAVVDGEIVTFDEAGQPSFQRLGQRLHLQREHDIRLAVAEVPVVYALFDLLAIGEYDLMGLPLASRKRLLRRLLPAPGILRVLDHLEGDGRPLLDFCRGRGLEGVVAKRAISPYRPGPARSPDWVKMKCERDDEFVVVGFTRGEGARDKLGALDIASWDSGRLVYRGKVGSGLDDRTIDVLLERLAQRRVEQPAAEGEYGAAARGRTHVRPEVVVSVRFLGWTDSGHVWHPTFRGIRDDIDPSRCEAAPKRKGIESTPAPPEVKPRAEGASVEVHGSAFQSAAMSPPGGTSPRRKAQTAAEEAPRKEPEAPRVAGSQGSPRSQSSQRSQRSPGSPHADDRARAAITNPAKVLFPESGITKAELYRYYGDIAPFILPYLRDRPVMMVRYPDGIQGKSFYQWNVPPGAPSWMRTCRIRSETGADVEVFLVDDAEGLLYLANLACIPVHILASRCSSLDECDFLTIDFDIKDAPLAHAVDLALLLRDMLSEIGLLGYPKTSGQSGLHVFVPLGPGVSFTTARALADLLGHLLVQARPETATMERRIAKRGTRIYVDTGQTGASRTIVAPFSVRAQPGATVSTPLRWDEVVRSLDPARFTIRAVVDRARSMSDPMAPMRDARPSVATAVAKLEARMRAGRDSPR